LTRLFILLPCRYLGLPSLQSTKCWSDTPGIPRCLQMKFIPISKI
jgi:hypothetical protein